MQVLVIGASGKVGFRLTEHLARNTDHTPLAMIRDPEQRARFDLIAVDCVVGDLEQPFGHAMIGCDAVIFAAGSGGKTGKDKTVLIDHLGAISAAVHAHVHGIRRFVLLSAVNAVPDADTPIRHYHRAKAAADRFLVEHWELLDGDPLEWTTLHPGALHDDEPTGRIELREGVATGKGFVTGRAHTAMALAACLDHPETIGKQITVLDGSTPIAEAFAAI